MTTRKDVEVSICKCGRKPKLVLEWDVKQYNADCFKCGIHVDRKTGIGCIKAWNKKLERMEKSDEA